MRRRKQDEHLYGLAQRGAEVRLGELVHEVKNVIRLFPHLGDSFDKDELPLPFIIAEGAGRLTRTSAAEPPRRRRRMSATARKKISEAQKKRWAALRKAAKA
jgi:hypothetical protein